MQRMIETSLEMLCSFPPGMHKKLKCQKGPGRKAGEEVKGPRNLVCERE